MSLSECDSQYVRAAEGWLELGNHSEANEELEKVSASNRAQPEVLMLRWEIYAKAAQWKACEDIARALTVLRPDLSKWWNQLAHSLYKQHRIEDAYKTLGAVSDRFLSSTALSYNMAVYCCSLGKLEEARVWLKKGFEHSTDPDRMKLAALEDPALNGIWQA